MATDKAVATQSDSFELAGYAPDADSAMEVVKENLRGDAITEFDLPRVKVPAGGGKAWVIPTFEGEDITETLTGVIVDWGVRRQYWESSTSDGEGGPPDCSSVDGEVGIGNTGGISSVINSYDVDGKPAAYEYDCEACPLNQFGTAVGDDGQPREGKACKEQRMLFLLPEGELLPWAVPMPPTSIGPVRRYFQRMSSRAIPFYGVVTTIRLEQLRNGPNLYSVAAPSADRRLDSDELARVKSYRAGLLPMLATVQATPPTEGGDWPPEPDSREDDPGPEHE